MNSTIHVKSMKSKKGVHLTIDRGSHGSPLDNQKLIKFGLGSLVQKFCEFFQVDSGNQMKEGSRRLPFYFLLFLFCIRLRPTCGKRVIINGFFLH